MNLIAKTLKLVPIEPLLNLKQLLIYRELHLLPKYSGSSFPVAKSRWEALYTRLSVRVSVCSSIKQLVASSIEIHNLLTAS